MKTQIMAILLGGLGLLSQVPFAPIPAGAAAPAELQELWRTGQAAFEQGEIDKAVRLFEKAREMDDRQPRSWNYLGGVHFAREDYFQALLHFKQAFLLDPTDAKACNNIATTYEHLNQFGRAEQYYLRAIEIDETYAVPYRNLGVLYSQHLEKPNMARTYWELFLQMIPPGPQAENIKEALRELEEAAPPD